MPNFLQVLHWPFGREKIIEVDGQEAVSAELQKVKASGESLVIGGRGNINKASGSGGVNRIAGSGSSGAVGGRGSVCG